MNLDLLLPEDRTTIGEFGLFLSHDLDMIVTLDDRTKRIVDIADSRIHGKGYHALRDIAEGDLVMTAYGVVIGHQTEQHSIQHAMEVHLQPFTYGGKYLNHSCDSNLIVRSNERGIANFFASRPIKTREEVTYHYPMTEFEWAPTSEEKGNPCNCKSTKCEGIIESFSMLTLPGQKVLVDSGYVSSYLAKWFKEQ